MTESNPLNMSQPPEEELSDDEIFFGKITLKEVKKAIYLDRYKYILENRKKNKNKNMDDDSFRLIEVQSEPERFSTESSNSSVGSAISALAATASNSSIASANSELATTSSNSIAAPANSKLKMCSEIDTTKPVEEQLKIHEKRHQFSLSVDDSFIQLEKMISNMNTESNETGILYDTTATLKKAESCEELMKDLELNDPQIQSMDENRLKYYNLQEKTKHDNSHTTSTSKVKSYMTPIRKTKEVNLRVPLTEKNHLFKTPLSIKAKSPCRMKTQSKINKFDHISSPIASYIKERPHTPLPRNDSTKKPKSSIPKFICTPNKEKIPQSMEKKSQVMSHQHKILHPTKKLC
ncbi:unnamed protein product [Leptidea sinapis]|uniref:Uncharacterized protein n=1 Tax=Leptidea sinapis TaxID=189913 RepID=A0A5E4R3A6_9NEOP|nr:unnamed protein product [Leptidea sinapis]